MEILYTTQITYVHASILFLIVFGFAFVVAFIFSLIEYYSFDVVQLILGILAAASIVGIIIVGCNSVKVTVTVVNATTIETNYLQDNHIISQEGNILKTISEEDYQKTKNYISTTGE